MNSADIITAICARLDAAGLGYPITWPDTESTDTPPRIETDYILSDPERVTINGVHRYRGLFQVAVVLPDNSGAPASLRVCDQIAAVFPADTEFTAGASLVRVYKAPTISRGLNDRGAYRTPVTIPFEIIE